MTLGATSLIVLAFGRNKLLLPLSSHDLMYDLDKMGRCHYNPNPNTGMTMCNPLKIISLDSSPHEWNQHPASIATPFAASANTSAHHATVGNCDSVSSMSAATWEPAAAQVMRSLKTLALP